MASFSLDVSKWVAKANGNIEIVIRKVALDMFRRVIMRSPVRTGRFRGNWQVAINRVPDGTLELDDKNGSAAMSKATAAALRLKAGQSIFLVNNLPYARPLEHGYSKQAPGGMVKITVQEFGGVVQRAARSVK